MDLEYVYVSSIKSDETDENLQKLCDMFNFIKLKPPFGSKSITVDLLKQISGYDSKTLIVFNVTTKRISAITQRAITVAVESGFDEFQYNDSFLRELYTYLYQYCD